MYKGTHNMDMLNAVAAAKENPLAPVNRVENPDTAAFKTWLRLAKPKETYIYYVGDLAGARLELTSEPTLAARDSDDAMKSYDWSKHRYLYYVWREPLHSYASAVWAAYEAGKVELTQKRLANGLYEYRATKRAHVKPIRRLWQ